MGLLHNLRSAFCPLPRNSWLIYVCQLCRDAGGTGFYHPFSWCELYNPNHCWRLIDTRSKWAALDIRDDRRALESGQDLGSTGNICESTTPGFTRWIYALQIIIALHVLLYFFDSLPLAHLVFSIVCHIVYLQNFTPTWPLISLSSLAFISSCILVVTDHFMWFFYFSRLTSQARSARGRMYRGPNSDVPGFSDIATFFAVCVWLAPLFLFLSLSAGENALPTAGGEFRCAGKMVFESQRFHRRYEYPLHPSSHTPSSNSWFSLQDTRRCAAPRPPSTLATSH